MESAGHFLTSTHQLSGAPGVVRLTSDRLVGATCWRAWHPIKGTCGSSGRRRQAAEPVLGFSPVPPLRFSCCSGGVSSHPLWCYRSLWMVLKLRKKLRSPVAAFTRCDVWGLVLQGRLPFLWAGAGRCLYHQQPHPVQGPCWGVRGTGSQRLTAASRWMVVLLQMGKLRHA